MKKRDITKDSQMVIKDNTLIQRARHNLTTNQQKVLGYIISTIKPSDTELKKVEIPISEFCELCGMDKSNFYKDFKDIVEYTQDRGFWFYDETTKKNRFFFWFCGADYDNGIATITLAPTLSEYLIGLKQNFTQYELYNILALKSKYSIRLFEVFKSYLYQHKKTMDISELKSLLMAEQYTNYADFEKRVLKVATKEINYYTELNVRYEVGKTGKKVTTITFYIDLKKPLDRLESYWNTVDKIEQNNNYIRGQLSLFDGQGADNDNKHD